MILTMDEKNRTFERGYIGVENGIITYIGSEKVRGEEEIDGSGKVAIPGLINCHTHSPMTLFRGIAEDLPLKKWLENTIWPLEKRLRPHHVYWGALLACLEMVRTGTTCFNDQYFFMDEVARAVEKIGLRASLSWGLLELHDPERGEKELRKGVQFAEKYMKYANGRIVTKLGPHAEYSCSLEFLKRVRTEAHRLGIGIHMHLAESKYYVSEYIKRLGIHPVLSLAKINFLSHDVIVAHCIHIGDEEISTLTRYGVKVAYNPTANMKVALGIPRIVDMLKAGIIVGIGTDGPASNNSLDMFREMKQAALLQKIHYGDPTVLPARKVLRMATIDAAKVLGLEHTIGSLEVGKRADIVLVNLKGPHLTPLHDIYATLVYAASGADVDTVLVDGKIILHQGEILTVDEHQVIEKAIRASRELLEVVS
ncbi:MAG: N-ethylammeline chlorohydrolase [Thermoprotei archaeon]|nr:MAG: N-ethylammeline chlorohydrolase [Thermoprotei archaeon]RLE89142.1 MAG: N-ethylammeline chlorohydrolase [Thermoprotei archaeon]